MAIAAESQRQGLGDELLKEIRPAIRLLEEHPERRPMYCHGFRRLLTGRFPCRLLSLRGSPREISFGRNLSHNRERTGKAVRAPGKSSRHARILTYGSARNPAQQSRITTEGRRISVRGMIVRAIEA